MYTISPYDRHFFKHIDRGIHDVVQEFLDKGYLPYSSCEGHNGSRKFVAIAIHPDFKEQFDIFGKQVVIKELGANSSIEYVRQNGVLKGIIEPFFSIPHHIIQLNRAYKRGYDEYLIMDITFDSNEDMLKQIRRLPHYGL